MTENKINAILVDDENGSRKVLSKLLNKYVPEINIVGEAESVDGAYELINSVNPQLVFLDIQMPRANGFSLLQKFKSVPFEVIFITSFDQFAINAIKVNALDYLLKPVEINELKIAAEKAFTKIKNKINSNEQVVNLLMDFDINNHDKKVAVHVGEKVILIPVKDIIYIEADRRYSTIFLMAQYYTTARSIKEFEEYFGNNPLFVRINKSLLLNTQHIKQYLKGEPVIVELINGKMIEIPRRKKTEILDKLL